METRANFILIGAFTLAGMAGILGFFLWLAQIEADRQYAQYDVLFESVAGLGRAADVRFNGLPVGQVVALSLYDEDPNRIRVRIEVDGATPIRTGTVARLESQGVTGVSYVSLTGGRQEELLLSAASDDPIPVIRAERSAVQALTADAPDLLEEAIALLRELRGFVGPENQEYVRAILSNLATASDGLDTALADFSAISQSVREGTDQIRAFTGRLDEIGNSVEITLASANRTLITAESAIAQAETTLAAATEALGSADRALSSTDRFVAEDLSAATADARRAIATLAETATAIGANTDAIGAQAGAALNTATARLAELEGTIAAIDDAVTAAEQSFAAIGSASSSVDALVTAEGAPLAAEARATLAEARRTLGTVDTVVGQADESVAAATRALTAAEGALTQADTFIAGDLTALAQRLREAVGEADRTVATVAAALVDTGDRIGTAADMASARLAGLEGTLTRVDATLAEAQASFAAIEAAAAGVDGLIQGDAGALVGEAQGALAALRTGLAALDRVLAEDVPLIVGDVRDAAQTANRVIGAVGTDLTAAADRVDPLLTQGEAALSAATETLLTAGESLDRIDTAVATADRAFAAATLVIERDAAPATADIRAAARSVEQTLATVSEDLPQIAADLRGAVASARTAAAEIEAAVAATGPGVEDFAETGLPQFTRFAREAEALVERLDRLTQQIERDPARFFFGNEPGDFRR